MKDKKLNSRALEICGIHGGMVERCFFGNAQGVTDNMGEIYSFLTNIFPLTSQSWYVGIVYGCSSNAQTVTDNTEERASAT